MIDKLEISSTFERVEKSLNLRFQKKGSLFISKDDLEKLKRELFNSNIQNILALESKIEIPIIIQVILKNPWLISNKFLQNKDFQKYIKEKLLANNAKQYLSILKDIVQDNIFSTNQFKAFIENFYYILVDVKECKRIIKEDSSKPKILFECFKRVITESEEEDEIKIREINDFLESKPEVYKLIKNTADLNQLINTMHNKGYIAEWILENKTVPKIDPVWSNAFISLGRESFDVAVEHITNRFTYDEVSKWIIRNVFQKQLNINDSNVDYYIDKLISIYRNRNAYRIKILFLDMLQPGKFKNHDLKIRLINEFERIGISEKYDERVEKIRKGEEDSIGYDSQIDAYKDITKDSSDIDKHKTLEYIARQFKKTDYVVLLELYTNHSDNTKVQKAISYYIANEMRKKESTLLKKIGDLSSEYIELIVEYISEYSIDSKATINFLHKNDRADIIEKLTRR